MSNETKVFVVIADDLEIEFNVFWLAAVFLTRDEAEAYVIREKREDVWQDWLKKKEAWEAIHYPIPGPDSDATWPIPPEGERYGFTILEGVLGRDVPTISPRPQWVGP